MITYPFGFTSLLADCCPYLTIRRRHRCEHSETRCVSCHNRPQSRNRVLKSLGHALHMPAEHDDVERLLDAALEQTFPASDPIAIDVTPRNPSVPNLNN